MSRSDLPGDWLDNQQMHQGKHKMKRSLKNAVKKAFGACGLDINRKGTARTLTQVLEHVSSLGFKPRLVIDVGVAFGTFELYEKFPDATHLLVEPLEEYEETLKAIARDYDAQYVIAAASNRPGTITINVHSDLAGSSILEETEGCHVDRAKREVTAITLDELCNSRHLKGPYLIKVDVQGAELKVLEGAKKILEETEVIILEVSLFQFYTEGPQFYDVVNYMKKQGFVAYDVFGGHRRALDGALAQVDIVFVKESGQFRKDHRYATESQRKEHEEKMKFMEH